MLATPSIKLNFQWARVRQYPIHVIASKSAQKIAGLAIFILMLPLTAVFHVLGYRRATIFTDRIGHLAIEPDCLLKEQALGNIPSYKWILLAPPGRVANMHLLAYWAPHFWVIHHPIGCFVVESMSRFSLMRYDVSHFVLNTESQQAAYRIYADWGDRKPIVSLTAEDEAWGIEMLSRLGLPKDAWFVCVHVREGGFSPIDEELHSHRNGTLENTFPAMLEIVRRGGWVIRIGDPSMTPMPPMEHVIDYAHHPLKSARMDIFLSAKTRFLLGNTSGIALVSNIFGVPCAICNAIPVSTMWFGREDLVIPKLIWSAARDRYLRFEEIFGSPVSNYNLAPLYRHEEYYVHENTADAVRNLTQEMLDRLERNFEELPEDKVRSQQFRSLLSPSDLGFASSSQIAVSFLRTNSFLLM